MDPLIYDEAIKDQGALNSHPSYTDKDFEGHRAHDVYVGVHIGSTHKRHPRHRRHRHHHHRHRRGEESGDDRPLTPPAQRVHFLLGEEEDDMHESHPLFSEMEELHIDGDEVEWRETARWVKFEEDVEEGGNRWSKPHVATLSLHSLFELRSCVLNGTVMLDLEGTSLEQIADLVLENMVNAKHIQDDQRDRIKEILLKRHRHLHERRHDNKTSRIPLIRSLADIGRVHSSSKSMTQEGNTTVSATTGQPAPLQPPTSPTNTAESHHYGRFLLPGKQQQVNPTQSQPSNGSHSTPAATALTLANQSVKAVHFQELPGSPSQGDHLQPSLSGASLTQNHSGGHLQSNNHDNILSTASATDIQQIKGNQHFMKKLPPGAEASNILVGELDFMERTICAFVRLSQAVFLGDLTEVPLPTKFIFILLGPQARSRYHEIGRAVATLLADEVFHDVAYKGKCRLDLLAGVDEFLDAVTVLPPGEWDPSIRIEPPQKIPSQDHRKAPDQPKEEVDDGAEEEKLREECGLKRTGRLFGGLINDIKRKAPWYWSDFKDAMAIQCLASFIFLYFACLTPIITFGGLLGKATNNLMAALESLVAGCVCGIIYAAFSGQPLTILSSTGPVLVFETIAYIFCDDNNIEYLPFRLWIGVWTSIILFILVALDASAFVCYITRFTEENFACLISLIFIYNAIVNLLEIRDDFRVNALPATLFNQECNCEPGENVTEFDQLNTNWSMFTRQECLANNGTLLGTGCSYYPDVFFLSIILFASTYIISFTLKEFKTTSFFPSKVRQIFNDFAVIIAILSMTLLDFLVGIPTPKLDVPEKFEPTSKERGWFIHPFGEKNKWWTSIAAIIPALLATILIFMDQQITAVIVNRKEHKLKKGGGYHLDLFVLAFLILICSFMGLPWFVAGTVLSVTHVNTLKVESECAAPGEKPKFKGVREQRVTHMAIFVMIGLSVILTPVLRCIPMPVLFGVFLYMGTSSLKDLQFFDRILIMFMPAKYQPDYTFLRQVPLKRVYLFTFIQIACLVTLWVVKTFKSTSIAFPIMLVIMIGVRKLLDLVFTQRELKILDDVMPESSRKKREEDETEKPYDKFRTPSDVPGIQFADGENLEISLYNGNIMKIPIENLQHYPEPEPNINISEEVNKSGIWKQVNNAKAINGVNHTGDSNKHHTDNNHTKKRGTKKDAMNEEERKRLSTMAEEEDEDDTPIMIKIDSPTPITTPNQSEGLVVKLNQNNETSV
uniref:Anion exchange protein n=1 Tax=Strigamia maritima TaxID=126957 RepID=T1IXC2_STRMM